MSEKILIVDDDANILKAYERRLRKRFDVETALCSEEGVTAVDILGPFAVIVSDMMMPRENGAEFFARVLKTAPDSVRIMLTGNADQATAAAAINQGHVFRFLNKPCEAEELEQAIADGIEEHRRRVAEKELLTKTVGGAIDMLTKVLAATDPEAFGRSARIRSIVTSICEAAELVDSWRHQMAASLSQIGLVATPVPVLAKHAAGETLTAEEQHTFESHPRLGSELIGSIPKLEEVAEIVAHQNSSHPANELNEPASVAFGGGLLRLAIDFDRLVHDDECPRPAAIEALRADADRYPKAALAALRQIVGREQACQLVRVAISELADGMLLVDPVETTDGALLVAKGQEVTPSLRGRLTNYATTHEVREPIAALATAAMIAELGLEPAEPATA